MTLAAAFASLLAGAALPAADSAALDARVNEMYRGYRVATPPRAAWEYPYFSADTAKLIAHWQRVMPQDELDGLNDGDWFCACQDWDNRKFRHTVLAREAGAAGTAQVRVLVNLGWGTGTRQRLVFRKERNGWRLDDMFEKDSFPRGLKQALRETIAEDEKLAK